MGDYLPEVHLGSGYFVTEPADGSLGDHTCVLVDNGSISGLKCYGRNYYGQLGLNDNENRGDDVDEMGDYLPFIDGYQWTNSPTVIPTETTEPTARPSTEYPSEIPPLSSSTNDSENLRSTNLIFEVDEDPSVVQKDTNLILEAVIVITGVMLIATCSLLIFCVLRQRKLQLQRKKTNSPRRNGVNRRSPRHLERVMNSSADNMVDDQMEGMSDLGIDAMSMSDIGIDEFINLPSSQQEGKFADRGPHPVGVTAGVLSQRSTQTEEDLYGTYHVVVHGMISRKGDEFAD